MELATVVETTIRVDVIKDDPDDNKILECAFEAKADYIVSGDELLLKQENFLQNKNFVPQDKVILYPTVKKILRGLKLDVTDFISSGNQRIILNLKFIQRRYIRTQVPIYHQIGVISELLF